MIWACFLITGPEHLAVIRSSMISSFYQSILFSLEVGLCYAAVQAH